MALKVIEGNLLDIESGIICHQVNCMGVMGSGIAKQIRDKWPIVFKEYEERHSYTSNLSLLFGSYDLIKVTDTLKVANIYGQFDYGTDSRKTNYAAVATGFNLLNTRLQYTATLYGIDYAPIYVPYLMGCGLAGGDWEIYQEIIEFNFPYAIVVKYNS